MANQVDDLLLESDPNLQLNSILYENFYEFSQELDIISTYSTEKNAISELSKIKDNLSIISLNTQSLFSKYTDLTCFLHECAKQEVFPSVLALQETWITEHTNMNHLKFNNYKFIGTHRKHARGGGIGCLVHNSFKFEEILTEYFLEGIHESQVLKITNNNFKFYLINIYRPPHENQNQLDQFFDIYSELVDILSDYNAPLFICGDTNFNIFETTNSNSNASRFIDIMIYNGFLNTTLRATRVTPHSFSLLDIFFVKNFIPNHFKSLILTTDISDHFPVLNIFHKKVMKPSQKLNDFERRNVSEENLASLNNALLLYNWDYVINATDINVAYSLFISAFTDLYNIHCPKKTVKNNRKTVRQQKYTNDHLLKCRNFKHYLYRKQLKNRSENDIENYKQYRNELRRSFKRAKQNYFQSQISKAGKDHRKIWQVLREAMGVEKSESDIDHLIINGNKVSDPKQMSNAFNSFFTNLGTSLLDQIPITNKNFREYLPNGINETIFIEPLDHLATFNLLTSCFPKQSTDSEDVSMKTIIHCAASLSIPLTAIYNLSLSTAQFPDGMKISKCIVLFKGGDTASPDCYRCLSLISNFSKPLEKLVFNKIYKFLDEKKFFSMRQYGFRKSISTMHNLLNLSNLVTETFAENKVGAAVLIDIKKAFDLVDRNILFEKLAHFGIRGKLLSWIKSYFLGRKQKIYFKECWSDLMETTLGILAGSVLGPLFFIIFINDIEYALLDAFFNLFADDSITYLKAESFTLLMNKIQASLPHIVSWYSANRLIINSKKTKIIIFSTPRQTYTEEELLLKEQFPIYMNTNDYGQTDGNKITKLSLIHNNSESEENRSATHLGVKLDEKLNYKFHFSNLHRRLQRAVFSLKLMKNILDRRHLKILYSAYCKSILEYSNIIFTGVTSDTLKPIRTLQKSCARIIAKTNNNRANTSPLFKQYRILPYDELMTFNICKFMFDYKHGLSPKIFENTWNYIQNVHDHETRNRGDFRTLVSQKQYIMNSPLYKFPRIFNSLPANIKNIENEKEFRRKLFNHLINNIN